MKQLASLLLLLLTYNCFLAQTLKGNLKNHAGQQITLTGFNYYKNYQLAKTTIDSLGNFTLTYPKNYKGMGILNTQDNSGLVVVLTTPKTVLNGTHLKVIDSLKFIASPQNTLLATFANHSQLRQQKYQAWRYLMPLYKKEQHTSKILQTITQEATRIAQADSLEISQIPQKYTYVRWFLPLRILVSNMPATVRSYTERLPKNIQQFRHINFNNPYFKTSGLFKELIEGHYRLLENMVQPTDSMYAQMNKSTAYLLENLKNNESLLNTVSEQLFNYFEERSFFKASEYLANYLLKQNQCSIEDGLLKKLESYRKLKVGTLAPDIQLKNKVQLSQIKKNKLLVFGASWCPTCKADYKPLVAFYTSLKKSKNLEVVYISIDTDAVAYTNFYKNAPFTTYCDTKGWDTQSAKDYYISGTPTYFLLDAKNTILLRANSLKHAKNWVATNL
ncbi:MAG: TlpA family protein disulfide reductase [Polaribacter sp.]